MNDEQYVSFLQWALPRLRMRWPGFRKVRGQVCKRLNRRLRKLGLAGIDDYRDYLAAHADEWGHLDSLCRITITRFCRDRGVFAALGKEVLPVLLGTARERGDGVVRIWSAGCGAGEEPYTLALMWAHEFEPAHPEAKLDIVATDIDPVMIRRALDAGYAYSSVKELPARWRTPGFSQADDEYYLKPKFRRAVRFFEQDIRRELPEGRFDLVLCRNLVFTYFDQALQRQLAADLTAAMQTGAALVLGAHESMPQDVPGLSVWLHEHRIYRKDTRSDTPEIDQEP